MAFISVIIPVYNCKLYLQQAVDSVLNQPLKDISVVLVDDGSTDGSAELCDQLTENERVKVIHQANAGVSAARNAGMDYVLGGDTCKYIAFLDADDIWCPDVLTPELIEECIKDSEPDCYSFGAVLSDCELKHFSRPYIEGESKLKGYDSIWQLQRKHFGANLYSLELLRNGKIIFPIGLKYNEDKIFLMQCSYLAKNVCFREKVLHVYRINPVSAMSKVRSFSAIDYYLPLIDSWVKSDKFLESMELSEKKKFGRVVHWLLYSFWKWQRDTLSNGRPVGSCGKCYITIRILNCLRV